MRKLKKKFLVMHNNKHMYICMGLHANMKEQTKKSTCLPCNAESFTGKKIQTYITIVYKNFTVNFSICKTIANNLLKKVKITTKSTDNK